MTHKVTDTSTQLVQCMAESGQTYEVIAKCLGVHQQTLVKHYGSTLDTFKGMALMEVGKTLFAKAISGDVTACIFILKTQGGWKEPKTVDIVYHIA